MPSRVEVINCRDYDASERMGKPMYLNDYHIAPRIKETIDYVLEDGPWKFVQAVPIVIGGNTTSIQLIFTRNLA